MGVSENIIMILVIIVLSAILAGLSIYKKKRGESEEFSKTSLNVAEKKPVGKKENKKNEEVKGEQITLNKGFKYVVSEKNKIKPGKYVVETKNATGLTNNDSILEVGKEGKINLNEGDKISSKDHKIIIQKIV